MADKYKGKILVESDDWDFKDFRIRELEARIRELEADLADARLIAREQEDAHVAAKLRSSERSPEGVQCMRCGGVYNGQGDINLCPSCRPPPVDNAHVAEGCELFTGSPLNDTTQDRGAEHD